MVTRRQFLPLVAAPLAHAAPVEGQRPRAIPAHLPDRLAICYIGWEWVTEALPDEPYGDIERMLGEVKERGYNCVRAEAGLNWMFDLQGRRRGKLKFRGWVEGASFNLQCHGFTKGGGVHDVFERVIRLFELARKHNLYVITTSWEYQDAISHLADTQIRDEIIGVPYNDRLNLFAAHYHRLLTELKKRGLQKQIALVELINEYNHPPVFCAMPGTPRQTFSEWVAAKSPTPACPPGRVRELAYNAVAFLRERHPDLLITVDLANSADLDVIWPMNGQVADHHVYSDGIVQAFWREAGIAGIRPGQPPDLAKNAFLRQYLKPDPMPWEEIVKRGAHVRQNWWSIAWLYENLNNEKFDEWCQAHYAEYRQRIRASIEKKFQVASEFAAKHRLPLVVDEGGILYPPQKSRFVMMPEGREGEELFVNTAIATGHWGVLPTGYTRPDTLTWHEPSQIEWVRRMNRRILETKTKTAGA